jgi:3'-phosphoadenosine 5'-phosphosulfate sulfotransferase (PAPS reductase)/FAD synthetase
MTTEQTKLSEVTLNTRSPKHHRLRKKKSFQKDYDVEATDFEGIIKEAEKLGRDTFIVGYSGGKDSGKVLHKLNEMGKLYGVLHLKTNTGVQATEDFVIDECKRLGVKLFIREPTPLSFSYVAYCLQFGFPSVRLHSSIMKILKYNSMKKFIQEPQFKNKNPAIVGGIRKFESERRFGSYESPITQETDLWFVNPIFNESVEEVYEYFLKNGLRRSPTYETLGFSGECLCGCFATIDEAQMLKKVDPNRFEFLEWIADGIKRFGSPEAKKYSKWGKDGVADMEKIREQEILEIFFDSDEMKNIKSMELNSCGSECGASTLRGTMDTV